MDDIKIGFCQCCGRSVKLINPKGKKQSEWDTIATNTCDCQKKGKKTMKNIKKYLEDQFEKEKIVGMTIIM